MFHSTRPAIAALVLWLLPPLAHPAKETLRIQVGKDDEILDTVILWFEYDRLPEVAPPQGEWSELEKDSVGLNEVLSVDYNHNFLAQIGSRKGFGHDYISYRTTPDPSAPQYQSWLSFNFRGDTSLSYTWEVIHMNDYPEARPYELGIRSNGTGVYGQVSKLVGGEGENLAQGQWALIYSREKGWTGAEGPTALRPVGAAPKQDGWMFSYAPGALLNPPPGAKALRIFDLQGRLHWEARDLAQGARVELPGSLPRKALRYRWVTGPG